MDNAGKASGTAIGANIRRLRERYFPGREGIVICARVFGVTAGQWMEWEKGTRIPAEKRVKAIAALFGVEARWLRTAREAPESSPFADEAAAIYWQILELCVRGLTWDPKCGVPPFPAEGLDGLAGVVARWVEESRWILCPHANPSERFGGATFSRSTVTMGARVDAKSASLFCSIR